MPTVKCSRCDNPENLHLVTVPYEPGSEPGRLMLYCADCRSELRSHLAVSIPSELVTPELFLGLYRLGKTRSEPHTACEIAFGKEDQRIIQQASELLAQQNK